jgi:PBP1b-binding outer membrane lipoprotein LpoB
MEANGMRCNKKITITVLLVPTLFLSGCSSEQKPVQSVAPPHLVEMQQRDALEKRFQESAPQNPTIVESALELSEKYARLSDEAAVLRRQSQILVDKNKQLNSQIATLEAQLQQTQKELTEANDLLIEMRIDLNNWKSNILGFREEMREAQTTQLQALLSILKILGGKVSVESAKNENKGTAVTSLAKANQP